MALPSPVGDTDTTPSPPDTPTSMPKIDGLQLPTHTTEASTYIPPPMDEEEMEELSDIILPSLPLQGGQKTMVLHPTPPTLPFSPSVPETSEEEDLHTELEVTETNRSIVCVHAPSAQNTTPYFTPTPEGGFPSIHLLHAASSFDYIDQAIINAWIQVGGPKFLVRIFDYDGKDHENMNAVITQRIRNTVAEIMNTHNLGPINVRVTSPSPTNGKDAKEFPKTFLVFDIPTEVMDMVIHQRIWSSQEIMIEARPFISHELPTTFFCLNGFTTTNENSVRKAIYNTWTSPQILENIVVILEKSEIPLDRCYDAAMYLCDSISVKFVDYKGQKAISLPCFNIYAKCPSNRPKIWTSLGATLMTIHYPTPLDGKGISIPFTTCSLCHSIGHPNGLCRFPDLPLWNGPKHKNKSAKYTPKVWGKVKDARRV
ncbi:hypothetical protein F4604DRAFT_1915980 [Suillus subluteus]|nr:hypothetical protein F4604DRAFT_1915980 [Suillus subluteus]